MNSGITGMASISIDAPVANVWEALTTPSIIKQYFFGTNAISDWKVGSPLLFRGEWEGKSYEDKGVILDSVPNKLFVYKYWSSMSGIEDKPENYVTITYELKEEPNGTRLQIKQENIQDEKMKAHSEQNWNKVLGDLKQLLEKQISKNKSTTY
ncbi:MAG: SRPBCC family protein [Chitinophagaceae bacterium]